MRGVVGLLSLCVVLAILRAALVALAIMLLLALVYSFIRRPPETLVFLGTLALSAMAVAHPILCISALAVVAIVGGVIRPPMKQAPPSQLVRSVRH